MKKDCNIFEYLDYKDYLKNLLSHPSARRGIQSTMARAMGCQAAYLYQVLHGKAHLTEDHTFKLSIFLNLSDPERDFLFNLVAHARASTTEFQNYLKKKLQQQSKASLDLSRRSDSEVVQLNTDTWNYYFSSALPSAIHILTSSHLYQSSHTIAQRLQINEKEILWHLEKLLSFGLVERQNGVWKHTGKSIHFPKDSPFNLTLQSMRRIQAMHSTLHPRESDTHFATLFTLDEKTYATLRLKLVEFIENSQEMIHSGGSDQMYTLCLDLFEA